MFCEQFRSSHFLFYYGNVQISFCELVHIYASFLIWLNSVYHKSLLFLIIFPQITRNFNSWVTLKFLVVQRPCVPCFHSQHPIFGRYLVPLPTDLRPFQTPKGQLVLFWLTPCVSWRRGTIPRPFCNVSPYPFWRFHDHDFYCFQFQQLSKLKQ